MSALPVKRPRVTQFAPQAAPSLQFFNEKAERAVIGAVLQKPDLFPTLSHLLQPGDFWSLFYGLVWYALDKMSADGSAIDIITVADAIEREKSNPYKNDSAALMNELASLYGAAADSDHAEDYARQVREAAMQMRVLKAIEDTKADILAGNLHGEVLKDEINRRVFEATEQSVERKADASAMMAAFIDSFEGTLTTTVKSGFTQLDNLLNGHGFYPGEVAVWAGAAGMGKTTSLLSIARNAAKAGHGVALFTMEMEQSEIAQALIAMETGIHRATLQKKRLSAQQYEAMVTAAGMIGAWNLHTIDMHEFPALKPLQLKRKLRSLMVQHPIDFVILDGLWLMQPDEATPNRFEAVGEIMRDLSGIAKQFSVPILLAHQYKEGMQKAKKPRLDMLAESSGVQRNAQVVVGMWRASYFDDDSSADTYAHVLKNRNRGMLGSAIVPYNVKYNRFGDDYE